jgi:hypothetical protein
MTNLANSDKTWPTLRLDDWKDTYATLHMWSQIVGKIRLVQTPLENHWRNVVLYVTPRGLTTSAMPFDNGLFQIDFDFIDHNLLLTTSDGVTRQLPLQPRSVAAFYKNLLGELHQLGIDVKIRAIPDEVPNPIPFAEDDTHKSYNPEFANRFWRILIQVDRIFTEFRSRFIGKCSPVHFFWGSFDLAVTRFSGRRAPERPGADSITREAYSHEVISCGFWPGTGSTEAAFYAYAAPAPAGLESTELAIPGATYSKELGEFFLPYEVVRQADEPDKLLMDFLQRTYEASANLANWNRKELERL